MTVWGDILTFVAVKRGVGGTVIDGMCRDVGRSLELRYPLFSRGWSMRTGKGRVELDALNVTVSIGGARVSPGDLLLGDADGVVAVPQEKEQEVIAQAKAIEEAETRIREAVEGGMRLDEARRKFRYFKLQSRER
jgi:regulator of RNase E activity RraA